MKQIICSKRIAIYCVTYHSYEALYGYLESIEEAAKKVADCVTVDVFVADNTDSEPQTIDYKAENFSLLVLPFHENLGYFGAVGRMMRDNNPVTFDYVIISNVDLTINNEAFIHLAEMPLMPQTGWIAPQIYSKKENRDLNPKIMKRYTLRRLRVLQLMHRFPLLHYIYSKTLYNRQRGVNNLGASIYAGHGSFIILTKAFFEQCGIIDYPVFLFCEEIYLAEQCRKAGLEVVHQPIIRIIDTEHTSTGKMSTTLYSHYNYEAVSYILHRFYYNK